MPLSDRQTEGRAQCLANASELAALFNEDPHESYFEFWHRKAGRLPSDDKESEPLFWGNALEGAIAKGLAVREGWKIYGVRRHLVAGWNLVVSELGLEKSTAEMHELRRRWAFPLGASLDFQVSTGSLGAEDAILELVRRGVSLPARLPLQIKAVGRYATSKWEGRQPPLSVLLQEHGEMICSNAPLAVVGGLLSPTSATVAFVPRHKDTIRLIFRAVLDLEISLARGEAPAPDLERSGDIEAVIALHRVVTPGKVLDLRGDPKVEQILADYRDIATVKGCAQKEQDRLWAELLVHLGPDADFRELIANESKATRWEVPEKEVPAHTKKAFTSYGVYRRKS